MEDTRGTIRSILAQLTCDRLPVAGELLARLDALPCPLRAHHGAEAIATLREAQDFCRAAERWPEAA